MWNGKVAAVVAMCRGSRGIGIEGQLPWRIPGDLKRFKKITSTVPSTASAGAKNVVIMGRKTWESIPSKFRPLPGRINMVLSRNANVRQTCDLPTETLSATSFDEAITSLNALQRSGTPVGDVFVIGGASLYEEGLRTGVCDRVFLTEVDSEASCDVFFPKLPASFSLSSEEPAVEENGITYSFKLYSAAPAVSGETKQAPPTAQVPAPAAGPHEEMQYLDLIREIITSGNRRMDRTGTGTLSKFGATMRFSLRDNTLPLLTTKKTFWRGVAEELLWFVSGATNANLLREKNIHIWDGNGSREYLDSLGLTEREEGDLGPVYGFQWRHFGAEYKTMHDDYTGQGVDQIAKLIHTIKTNPTDRRMIVSAWNPAAFHLMALPPCHMFAQFYVANGELSCQMYQRSADMGLGVPFNIASYSLLTHMVAHVTGLKAGEFVHVIGDAHVYLNHVEPLQTQLQREPRPFPKLRIKRTVTDIDDFTYDDFEVIGYKPHKRIKMKMSV